MNSRGEHMEKVKIQIEVMGGGSIPTYANYNDAGADVYSAENIIIRPMEKLVIPLNFKVALPEHVEMQVRPRSGLSLKTSLSIPNSPGTVDAGFRNVVGVIVENTYAIANLPYEMLYDDELRDKVQKDYHILKAESPKEVFTSYHDKDNSTAEVLNFFPFLVVDKMNNPYGTLYIEKGTKIAQVVFNEVIHAEFVQTEDIESIGTNRGGGFGSTGLK